jgi:hypothetical protein
MDDLTADPTRVGSTWLFPDGTTVPVISGGDGPEDAPAAPAAPEAPADAGPDLDAILDRGFAAETPAEPAAPAAPSATETPAASAPETPAPEAAKTGLEALPEEWQKEVLDAREEAKRYRLRAKDFNEITDGLDADSQAYLLDLNRALVSDPARAKEMLAELLSDTPADPATPAPTDPTAAPLTEQRLLELLNERDAQAKAAETAAQAKAEQDKALAAIDEKATALGYEPNSVDYVELLHLAVNDHEGDLDKAHAAVQARRQKIIDDYVAGKGQTPTPPSPTGAAPSGERQIGSLKEATAGLEEWLNAGATPGR